VPKDIKERVAVTEVRLDGHDCDISRLDITKAPLDRFTKIEKFFEKIVYTVILAVLGVGLAFILKP
jgi:hypothetical protein